MSDADGVRDAKGIPPGTSAPLSQPQPPPEQPSSKWTRRLIILAFWAVIAALGLPHWIWTTSIHRSNLPLDSMNAWADGKTCQVHYPLQIRLNATTTQFGDLQQLVSQVQQLLNTQNGSPLYSFHVTADGPSQEFGQNSAEAAQNVDSWPTHYRDSALTVNLEVDGKAKSTSSSLRSRAPVLDVRHNPGRSVDAATLPAFIANEIHRLFENEKNTMTYLLHGSSFAPEGLASEFPPDQRARLDSKATRAFKYASTYHLTFSLFASSASPSIWEIEEALEDFITPLLERMSSISKFTIDTQVQLYASFSPSIAGPQYDSSTREWKLQKTDLTGFINAAEWPLSPGIGSGPTINFVLYVPSKDQSPLVIAETGGKSWLIPQWGGVQILNPTGKQSEKLTVDDLRPVMLTFADQLTSLLGLPSSPASLSLRISSLTRETATSLILSASSTLGALARLTLKLTSIEIPGSVAKSVDESVRRLEQACGDIREGRFQSALENARIAESEAEEAFFEPSMVGQVYFPDEHKVAVYVPLLGPMAVPLVMAGIKEIRSLRERKRKTA